MNILVGVLILCSFLPYSTCKADMIAPYAISEIPFQTTPLKDHMPELGPALEVKIDYASGQGGRGIVTGFKSLSDADQYLHPGPGEIVAGVSANDVIEQGVLQLNKVGNNRRKRAFMFVFLMDKKKAEPDRSAVVKEDPRMRMHVLGSKKIFPEQRVTEDESLLNISVGKYGDGYAPQEWNCVLPSGKPREVVVSWMWSF